MSQALEPLAVSPELRAGATTGPLFVPNYECVLSRSPAGSMPRQCLRCCAGTARAGVNRWSPHGPRRTSITRLPQPGTRFGGVRRAPCMLILRRHGGASGVIDRVSVAQSEQNCGCRPREGTRSWQPQSSEWMRDAGSHVLQRPRASRDDHLRGVPGAGGGAIS